MTFVGPLHHRSDSQIWRLQRVDEALMDRDGGQDGHNFKCRFKDGRLGVLKLFWDQAPPERPSYFALQRECQNAAVLQMMQAALARTDNVGPVLVRPEPPSWDVALDNMRAFSDEYRQRNAHAQAAAADSAPSQRMKQLTVVQAAAAWPPPLVLDGKIRELRRDMTYIALVYEYVEEAPNDKAALEDTLAFYRDAGFSHTPRSLEKNWTANLLLDSSDLVAACGWDWVRWRTTAKKDSFLCTLDENGAQLIKRVEKFLSEGGVARALHGIDTTQRCLVHSDLTMDNLLFDKESNKMTALLDFDFASINHPVEEHYLPC
ncbi:hypothetical protein MY11210_000742 [Beauveria gryllotalpidicola]